MGMCLATHSCPAPCGPMDCSPPWAPLSTGLFRCPWQEYWGGLLFPPPGHLPDSGIKPVSPASPALPGIFFTTEPPGKPRGFEDFTWSTEHAARTFWCCSFLSITTESWFTLCLLWPCIFKELCDAKEAAWSQADYASIFSPSWALKFCSPFADIIQPICHV